MVRFVTRTTARRACRSLEYPYPDSLNDRTARQRHRGLVSSPPSQISTATPRAILVPLCGADDRGALDGDLSERAMRGLVVARHALRLPPF